MARPKRGSYSRAEPGTADWKNFESGAERNAFCQIDPFWSPANVITLSAVFSKVSLPATTATGQYRFAAAGVSISSPPTSKVQKSTSMFLSYFSLAVLLVGLMLVFYTFIYIHDIPYEIAKKRNHSQAEAIHVACWLSLFTLHAIWPIVYIWAIAKPRPLSVAIESGTLGTPDATTIERIAALEERLRKLEAATPTTTGGAAV